jgi:transposase-like protein
MSKKLNPDREKIIQKYVVEEKSLKQTAKELGIGRTTLSRYLKRYGIEKRNRYELHKKIFSKENNPFYGKHHTEEAKNNIRIKVAGEKHPRYIDGRSFLPYPVEFNQHLKDKIRERDNYICQSCSMTEEEHLTVFGTNLHVHHVDYNKFNCLEGNLITLCNNCNNRANFNKTYWLSFFQNKIGQTK